MLNSIHGIILNTSKQQKAVKDPHKQRNETQNFLLRKFCDVHEIGLPGT